MHPLNKRRMSLAPMPGPDRQAKADTLAVLSGKKKTLSEVNYTQASYSSRSRCSECKFYQDPDEPQSICDKVIGLVEANAVCDLFEQRDYNAPDPDSQPTTITVQVTMSGDE